MKQLIQKHLADCSDEKSFCFSLTCVECGAIWRSTPILFSKADAHSLTESKRIIAKVLYQREHHQALIKALDEAVHYFSICPLCSHMICNHCFIICDDLEMCRSCTDYLQEKGEAVEQEPFPKEEGIRWVGSFKLAER